MMFGSSIIDDPNQGALCLTPSKLRAGSCTLDGEAVPDGIVFDALHCRGTVGEAMLYAFDPWVRFPRPAAGRPQETIGEATGASSGHDGIFARRAATPRTLWVAIAE
jgi:hypothetical protein